MPELKRLLGILIFCASLSACAAVSDPCTINTAIVPANATADHSAATPGDQVQFSLSSSVKGNCPLLPDKLGSWSTSDPVNTTITNQTAAQAIVKCLNPTATSATITNSGSIRGRPFPAATLVCK